jgi:hypothetical protein
MNISFRPHVMIQTGLNVSRSQALHQLKEKSGSDDVTFDQDKNVIILVNPTMSYIDIKSEFSLGRWDSCW